MSPDRGSAGRSAEAGASRRRDGALLAAAALTASLTGCSLDTGALGEKITIAWEGTDPSAGADTRPSAGGGEPTRAVEAAPAPARLEIPRLGIRQQVADVGLEDDGTLEVPDRGGDIGWYTPDPRPGSPFPLVFTGHVDTPAGPAVFARLDELEPGDEVSVTDDAGTVRTYRVDRVADHPMDAYPTQEVFGAVSGDQLRLITCTGTFDGIRQQYDQNRVVYASRSG
ncbi:MAG TPA: class F sortase [Citricoccus sp.]